MQLEATRKITFGPVFESLKVLPYGVGQRLRNGFTLVELLVVISIISLLMALAVPTVVGTIGATRVTHAGEVVFGALSSAISRANISTRPVEVRIYKVPSDVDELHGKGDGFYRGILVLEYYQTGESDPRASNSAVTAAPLQQPLAIVREPIAMLPDGMAVSEEASFSSLISQLPSSSANTTAISMRTVTGYKDYTPPSGSYKSFVIYPESTGLAVASKWFLTLVNLDDVTKQPSQVKNFYTVQIDPVTARISTYRP